MTHLLFVYRVTQNSIPQWSTGLNNLMMLDFFKHNGNYIYFNKGHQKMLTVEYSAQNIYCLFKCMSSIDYWLS